MSTGLVTPALVALGGVATVGGAGLLVAAFRSGQAGAVERERRWFRLAVLGLAIGSALFVLALIGAPR